MFSAELPYRFAVIQVELIQDCHIEFRRIGSCPYVQNKIYLLCVFRDPLEKLLAVYLLTKFLTGIIYCFFRSAEIIHENDIILPLIVQLGNHAASDETRCAGEDDHVNGIGGSKIKKVVKWPSGRMNKCDFVNNFFDFGYNLLIHQGIKQ
jgi:hypothetical protein